MAERVFNAAKGRTRTLVEDARDTAAELIAVLIKAPRQVEDAFLDHATLAALLAANVECDAAAYARQTLTGLTVTVDNAGNLTGYDSDPISVNPGDPGDDPIGVVVVAHVPIGGTDANTTPLSFHDVTTIPDGSLVSYLVADFARSTN